MYIAGSSSELEPPRLLQLPLEHRKSRYLGRLPLGYLLEKLDPGPLTGTNLPPLTTFSSDGREPLLLLFYRWALQSLFLLAFLHEQGGYLMDFSSSTIWVRKDLFIALSGFVNATIPTDEWPYSPDGTPYEAEIYSHDPTVDGVKAWALPTDPLDPTEKPGEQVNPWEFHQERLKEAKLQLLEEERLGPILLKAWKGEYENAREILQEVRFYPEKIGVRMEGEDEVLPDDGRNWEDIFTVLREDGVRWSREIQYL
ncbi:predicted protein [Aspergillus terreus NIH2624]|uniref:Uncharacterized protein n=1 Tax=Aspergillus terreus (strain NIH 2624 / FGSC A1156) TaxID=341663 RepID=Q0CQ69_ASPTN|nr:uncharacterized protein ATEG_04165 [Aspergillus terreus NIH2624]EAU35967.1 predicted protein [Aspergillus terreus NIH2624]